MSMLMIKCPETGRWVPTGYSAADQKDFETKEYPVNKFLCRECGWSHTWTRTDVLLLEAQEQS